MHVTLKLVMGPQRTCVLLYLNFQKRGSKIMFKEVLYGALFVLAIRMRMSVELGLLFFFMHEHWTH